MRETASWLLGIVLALVCVDQASAQLIIVDGRAERDSLAQAFQLDFAVPDGPAFELLAVDPSDILRPTSVREVGTVVSSFTSPEGFTIPEAFAIEVAPFLLATGPRLSLREYQERPWLYRFRVSGATKRDGDDDEPTDFAIGARFTLLDESDLRGREEFVAAVTELSEKIRDVHVLAAKRRGRPEGDATIVLTAEEVEEVERLNEEIRSSWANKKWNARALDVAIGVLASSEGPEEDLDIQNYSGWVTYAHGIGAWGQVLIGGRAAAVRDSLTGSFEAAGSVSTRLYAGSNRAKGFIEAQGLWIEGEDADWLFNVGGEANLWTQGLWTVASAGIVRRGASDDVDLETSFSLRIGVPFHD